MSKKQQPDLYSFLPLGKHLSIVTKLYVGVITKKLERLEIKKHYSVLVLIEKSGDNCTQKFLCDFLKMDKASMARIIDELVKKGVVKRAINPHDRREHRLVLTLKAKKIMPRIHKAISEINAAAFSGLSKKEAQDFYKSISVIYNNLSKEPANPIIIDFKKVK